MPSSLTEQAATAGWGAADRPSPTASALAYDRRGHGEPLVLLHPLGADRHVWSPVLPTLSRQRDVLCVDLPGFGDSAPLTATAPHPQLLAGAVIELLAELGLDAGRAHVAGNSLGGWVALELAAAGHANTVTAIAPAGLWARPLTPKPEIARRIASATLPALPLAMKSAAFRRTVLGGSVAHPERIPPAQATALIRAYARAPGFTAVNRAMRASTFDLLSKIEVPITLVWPECDRVLTRPALLPASVRNISLAGCGHIPMWDNPDAVAALLLSGSSHQSTGRR